MSRRGNLHTNIVDREQQIYVIQRLNLTLGGWENVKGLCRVVGRSAAHRQRDALMGQNPGTKYRAIEKLAADMYRAGWKDHQMASSGFKRTG